jgi:prepilin-type N-terminal cleavage/methylation domain-containing protein
LKTIVKNKNGLTLVELISVIVLIGIIATFTSFFLYTGLNGYLNSKNSLEGALKAQLALDRITLELRDISYFSSAPTADSVSFISKDPQLPGLRKLKFQSGTETGEIRISVDGSEYPLLDSVSLFSLNVIYRNIDDDPSVDEVAAIKIGFKLAGIGREFRTQIFPRNLVEEK